jgi:nuclear pore complex protein Nup188
MGTLLELINCTLEILRRLTAQPAPLQAITPPGMRGEKPLNVRDSIFATRRTLEAMALYSVSQLALWIACPDTGEEGGAGVDMEPDDLAESSGGGPHDSRKLP